MHTRCPHVTTCRFAQLCAQAFHGRTHTRGRTNHSCPRPTAQAQVTDSPGLQRASVTMTTDSASSGCAQWPGRIQTVCITAVAMLLGSPQSPSASPSWPRADLSDVCGTCASPSTSGTRLQLPRVCAGCGVGPALHTRCLPGSSVSSS